MLTRLRGRELWTFWAGICRVNQRFKIRGVAGLDGGLSVGRKVKGLRNEHRLLITLRYHSAGAY